MSNTATAAKPAKTPASPAVTAEAPPANPGVAPAVTATPAPKLRAAQVKKFAPSTLKTVGFGKFDTLTIEVPADWSYDDVMNPLAWTNVVGIVAKDALNTKPDMIGSVIEVRTVDHAWFAVLYIQGITYDHLNQANGLKLTCIGPAFDRDGKACPIDLKTGRALGTAG
jgi:uncharacterized protein YciI